MGKAFNLDLPLYKNIMTTINYLAANSLSIFAPKYNKSFTLLPGLNLGIDDNLWSDVENHPLIKQYQDLRVITIVRSAPEVKTEFKAEKTVVQATEVKGVDELVPVNKPEAKTRKV